MADETVDTTGAAEDTAVEETTTEETVDAAPETERDWEDDLIDGYEDDETEDDDDAESTDEESVEDEGEGEPEESVPDSQKQGDVVDQTLAEHARMAGLNDEQVSKLADAGLLESVMGAVREALLFTPQQQSDETGQESEPFGSTEELNTLIDEMKEDGEYDEKVVGALETSAKTIAALEGKLSRMEEFLGQFEQAQQQQAFQAQVESFDRELNGLEEFASIFGTGTAADLETEHLENRARVWDAMTEMRAGAQALGRAVPDNATLVRKAVNREFGDKALEIARKEINSQLKKRQTVQRPTNKAKKSGEGQTSNLDKVWASIASGSDDGEFTL
jgi:hypothetical protein